MSDTRIIINSDHAPPSTNNLFKNVGLRRFKTAPYKAWLTAFGYDLNALGKQRIAGNYRMMLSVDPRRVRKGRDLSNFIKAIEDALVAHHVVDDDSLCQHVAALYEPCVKTIRIEITPVLPSDTILNMGEAA